MIPLSPALLVSTASAFAGLAEDDHGKSCEALVKSLRQQVPGIATGPTLGAAPGAVPGTKPAADDAPWDAALVHHLGFWAHFDPVLETSSWPLPPLPDAEAIAAFARKEGALRDVPDPGDLFLVWSPSSRCLSRVGVIVHIEKTVVHAEWRITYECVTVEGDTDTLFSPHGGRILRHWRRLSPSRGDRFVRWTELARRAVPVRPLAGDRRSA